VTDISVEPADFSGILAERTHVQEAERQRNIRRGIAAVAVLLVHILALAVFIFSNKLPKIVHIRTTMPEAIWVLTPQSPTAKPHPVQLQPTDHPEEQPLPPVTAPITLPPVHNPGLVRPQSGGLLGIGRSLACGASSYENLSPLQREQCLRHPWEWVKRPDGTIVMVTTPKPVEPPPTTMDIMRHEQQTAPPCPILNNVPCLGKVMHGDPLGGGPQPF
jgi:hypothetical protein